MFINEFCAKLRRRSNARNTQNQAFLTIDTNAKYPLLRIAAIYDRQ